MIQIGDIALKPYTDIVPIFRFEALALLCSCPLHLLHLHYPPRHYPLGPRRFGWRLQVNLFPFDCICIGPLAMVFLRSSSGCFRFRIAKSFNDIVDNEMPLSTVAGHILLQKQFGFLRSLAEGMQSLSLPHPANLAAKLERQLSLVSHLPQALGLNRRSKAGQNQISFSIC
ncbi:hypothetical protein M378DRAFT_172442, partial [Amanita muscaria Koide BX008]